MSCQPKSNPQPQQFQNESTLSKNSGTSQSKPVVVTHLPVSATSSDKPRRYENRPPADQVLKGLLEFYNVDPENGIITVKKNPGCGRQLAIGTVIGNNYKHNSKPARISIDNHDYMLHTLMWLFVHGEFPKHQLDHIDGNDKNNKIENLRDVPQHINNKNQKKHTNNTSGESNVHYLKSADLWYVRFTVAKRHVYNKYFKNFDDAVAARDAFLENNPYGFTKRHGQEDNAPIGRIPASQFNSTGDSK